MNRRRYIAGAGLALSTTVAGCVGGILEDDDPHAPGELERQISIGDVDDLPDDVPLKFDAHVVNGTVTADETAIIEVSVTNLGYNRAVVQTPYYKGRSASDGEPGIILHSLDAPDAPSDEYTSDCIYNPGQTHEPHEFTDEGPPTHTLDYNETGTDRLRVLDDPTVDGCFPTGEYRFEKTPETAANVVIDSDADLDPWGFTLEVSD